MSRLDLLCARLGDQHFAVPLERVIGIVECSPLTPLPFSPPSFEGLVQAMGQVVPQVRLGNLFGEPQAEGGVLVLITDMGGSIALRVPQVSAMIQIEAESVQMLSEEERIVAPLFAGHFTYQDQPYSVLDLDRFTSGGTLDPGGETGSVILGSGLPAQAPTDQDPGLGHQPFILVEVAGEPYVLRTEDVIEMVAVAEIRPTPHAPEWVAGLIDLRGAPAVAVSIARRLGGEEPGRQAVALIVPHGAEGQVVALLADRAVAIDRFPVEAIHSMTEARAGVESYLISPQKSIIGIIAPSKLLAEVGDELSALIPHVEAQPEERDLAPEDIQRILTLRVGEELCAIPLERITRILASVQLTPLPSEARGFDALADVGDAVVPVIDLRRQIAPSPTQPREDDQPPCVLTTIEGAISGLLVDQVLSIEDVTLERYETIEEAPVLPASHRAYVHGRSIPVLTLDRLLPKI
ncbi:MAG: chemotaxis protein CheW [Vicinamibacteria bacterium]|nr:chemotaxis protein CheW [Vicinamibacteria bacterium]